ncbi:hypothetical protein ACFL6W_02885 [Thermodesulfobacteriota bacterium]
MKTISTVKVWIILVMILMFIPCSNGLGQGSDSDGYGSYDKMGQDPDEILEYGRTMMRYGFQEGSAGGSSKYPGYDRDLNNETVKKLNAEQEAFIKATEGFRQIIYEKELYLKVELSKKEPDNETALSFQKELSDARGEFEQLMIQHLIRMKKINLDAEKK